MGAADATRRRVHKRGRGALGVAPDLLGDGDQPGAAIDLEREVVEAEHAALPLGPGEHAAWRQLVAEYDRCLPIKDGDWPRQRVTGEPERR